MSADDKNENETETELIESVIVRPKSLDPSKYGELMQHNTKRWDLARTRAACEKAFKEVVTPDVLRTLAQQLIEDALDPGLPAKARHVAMTILLDRTLGKPVQQVNSNVVTTQFNDDERREIIERIIG